MGGLAQDPKKALMGNHSAKRMRQDLTLAAQPLNKRSTETVLGNVESDLKYTLAGEPLAPPTLPPEQAMPAMDDEEMQKSRRRSVANRGSRMGRGSTLLYRSGNGLGG